MIITGYVSSSSTFYIFSALQLRVIFIQGKSSSDDTSGKVDIPERKSKSVCDNKTSQPGPIQTKSRPTGPSLPSFGGRCRKPSLGHATSLPLPQRSNSTGMIEGIWSKLHEPYIQTDMVPIADLRTFVSRS